MRALKDISRKSWAGVAIRPLALEGGGVAGKGLAQRRKVQHLLGGLKCRAKSDPSVERIKLGFLACVESLRMVLLKNYLFMRLI
jgi:hypothetical protein